jgi:hypothetical protein
MMDAIYQKFINSIICKNSALQETHQESLEYWHPDEPPITTLFAALGDRIASDFEVTDQEVRNQMFSLIESAMGSDNQKLVTAVATGLIEGMISKIISQEGNLQQLIQQLGRLSRKHAEAWISE